MTMLPTSTSRVPSVSASQCTWLIRPPAFIAANVIVYWCGWETNRICLGLLAGLGLVFVIVKRLTAPDERLDLSGSSSSLSGNAVFR